MNRSRFTLTINGEPVLASPGETILNVARRLGQDIPLLCHSGTVTPEEACRLCLVEIRGEQRLVAACSTPVASGMAVETNTPRVMEERRAVLGMILADHYGDCQAPCNLTCPAGIDIQGYIALIARGLYTEATRLIRRTNPLPLTCGRVCPHPCESVCRRNRVDEAVNINHLKRFAADIAYRNLEGLNPLRSPLTGKRAAVVGGGPAGLTAAYFLAQKGHQPVILEAMDKLGGMLRYGIPYYRLPEDVLDREIQAVLNMGVTVKTGLIWGRDYSLPDLIEEGFDAIFLGVGAWVNNRLRLPGEDLPEIWPGTVFLNRIARGERVDPGKRVAVVGGGNTAMDCARTALRLGSEVIIFYRRSRKEMPAQAIEVEAAELEGAQLRVLTNPVEVLSSGGRLTGVKVIRMELGLPDASGRARPQPVEGSEETVPLDGLIVAIGQNPDGDLLGRDALTRDLPQTRWGSLVCNPETGQSKDPRIFAGGDMVTGAATAVEAIGAGRRAALAMDRFLAGKPPAAPKRFFITKGKLKEVDPVNFRGKPPLVRAQMPELEPHERQGNFQEVDLGLSEEQARAEARRCLACGCQAVHDCLLRDLADRFDMRQALESTVPAQPYQIRTGHPVLVVDDNKCVVCRKCQRVCDEYHGRRAIRVEMEAVERLGDYRRHKVVINERCDQCGLCAAVCPTGALTPKTPWDQPGPWPLESGYSVCNLCTLGCQVRVRHIDGAPVLMEAPSLPPNQGHLCRRGRFELLAFQSAPDRLVRPLVRREGALTEVDWDEALVVTARLLGEAVREHGPASVGGLSLGRASLEEMFTMAMLLGRGLGSGNIDLLEPWAAGLYPPPPPYQEIEEQDLVILLGEGLENRLRLLEPALHRLRARGGKAVLLSAGNGPLASRADLHLAHHPAASLALLIEALGTGPAEGELIGLLKKARKILILAAQPDPDPAVTKELEALAATVAGREGFRLGVIARADNAPAAALAGLFPGGGGAPDRKGGSWLTGPEMVSAAARGNMQALVVQMGLNPAQEETPPGLMEAAGGLQTLVVLASRPEPLTRRATVVLPRPICLETRGLFLSGDGGRRDVEAALAAPGDQPPGWLVLSLLGEMLGAAPAPADLSGLRRFMRREGAWPTYA